MMLSRDRVKRYYDRLGERMDAQAYYQDAAFDDLLAHLDLAHACVVYEFGCGTGRFAARILGGTLPGNAWYRGVDVSETMVTLAKKRLEPFGNRAQVTRTDGTMRIDAPDRSMDVIVCTYVLGILSDADTHAFLTECRRVLTHDGQLGLIALTHGTNLSSRALVAAWKGLFAMSPATVGGCRPVALRAYLPEADWAIAHRAVTISRAIPSEILVARPRFAARSM